MMMSHPLIPVSLPPASVTMAMSQMNHLSTIANMAAAAQVQCAPSRMTTSVIKVRSGAVAEQLLTLTHTSTALSQSQHTQSISSACRLSILSLVTE